MFLLAILLGVLLVGIVSFVAGQYWEKVRNRHLYKPASLTDSLEDLNRCRIKKELDELLGHYQQGKLTEERFLQLTDKLIDELADLKTDHAAALPTVG